MRILHYLDDFLIISEAGSDEGTRNLHALLALFDRLRVPVATDKVEGPAMCITFLGIELDSEQMIMRLPEDKLQALKVMIAEWLGKKSSTVRDLQSLVGKLQHASKVIRPGRTFLRRMFELLKGCGKKQQFVRLNASFCSDFMWWHMFLEAWNGIGMLHNPAESTPDVHLYSDVSGSFGCGAWFGRQWLQLPWPHAVSKWSIAAKELVPIILARVLWGIEWHNKLILVHCDNQAVVEVVNRGYSKDSTLMQMLRCIFFVAALFEFTIRAVHIPWDQNTAADAISRNNRSLFFLQVPATNPFPTPVPQTLIELVILQQPDWLSLDWSCLFRSCLKLGQLRIPGKRTHQGQAVTKDFVNLQK